MYGARPQRTIKTIIPQQKRYQSSIDTYAEDLVGKRVKVFWDDDGKWFNGKVAEYAFTTTMHLVSYDDGDHRYYDLNDKNAHSNERDDRNNNDAARK